MGYCFFPLRLENFIGLAVRRSYAHLIVEINGNRKGIFPDSIHCSEQPRGLPVRRSLEPICGITAVRMVARLALDGIQLCGAGVTALPPLAMLAMALNDASSCSRANIGGPNPSGFAHFQCGGVKTLASRSCRQSRRRRVE
jgi:hypothetical protein